MQLAYIDPGTGSMLLTVLVGIISAGGFAAKKLRLRLKFAFGGGRAAAREQEAARRVPVVAFGSLSSFRGVRR